MTAFTLISEAGGLAESDAGAAWPLLLRGAVSAACPPASLVDLPNAADSAGVTTYS